MNKFEGNNEPFKSVLPQGYTLNQLKQLSETELQALCDEQNLDISSVNHALAKAVSLPPNVPPQIPTVEKKLHPDHEFINYLLKVSENKEIDFERRVELDLNKIIRKPDEIDWAEKAAFEKLDLIDTLKDWKDRSELSHRVKELFKEHYLQKGLLIYDKYVKSDSPVPISEQTAARWTFAVLSREYNEQDNVSQRREGLAEALSYFGPNVKSMQEILYNLSLVLRDYANGIASDEDKTAINKLMMAIKGVYFSGSTSVNAGIYQVLVPSLAEEYKKKVDPNRLNQATLLGGAVYDIGEYFGKTYPKNPRPRRFDDELGHGG